MGGGGGCVNRSAAPKIVVLADLVGSVAADSATD
jgi:hypothetical protein